MDRSPADRGISMPYFVGTPTIKILFKLYRIPGLFRDAMDIELPKKLLLGEIHLPLQREEQ
jgi:hypothetical protein